jgi:hypothetical protein
MPLEGGAATSITSTDFASKAFELFSAPHTPGVPFLISRLVVVLHYAEDANGALAAQSQKRKRPHFPSQGQASIKDLFKRR